MHRLYLRAMRRHATSSWNRLLAILTIGSVVGMTGIGIAAAFSALPRWSPVPATAAFFALFFYPIGYRAWREERQRADAALLEHDGQNSQRRVGIVTGSGGQVELDEATFSERLDEAVRVGDDGQVRATRSDFGTSQSK